MKEALREVILAAPCDNDRAEHRYATDDYLDDRIEGARGYVAENGSAGGTPHPSFDVSDPLGDTLDDAFATLDQRFACVNQGGKTLFIRRPDPVRPRDEILEVWTRPEFVAFHADRPVFEEQETDDGTETVRIEPAKEWIKHAQRHSRVAFAPFPLYAGKNDYNLWDCFTPAKGDPSRGCEKFKAFLLDVICAGRTELRDWVWLWLAHAVHYPGDKPGTCLVIQGDGGSGKSTLGELLHTMWGAFSVHASDPDHVTGKHNKHQATAIMMISDEALYGGDPKVTSIIKDKVTSKKQRVEPKFIDSFEVDSCLRCVFIGNPKKVIPIEANGSDRRYACMSVSNVHRGDMEYFAELREEAEAGGLAALYQELSEFDPATVGLSWSNVREAPVTPERRKMRGLSLRRVVRAMVDIVEDGLMEVREPNGRTVLYIFNEDEETLVEKAHLRDVLYRYANQRDSRDDVNEVLEELFGEGMIKSKRRKVDFYVVDNSERDIGKDGLTECSKERAHCYAFPALKALRAVLEERFATKAIAAE